VTNSKLKHIGEKAFGSCLSLTSANFKSANDLDKIDSVVFISCDHLTRLSFPWTQQIPNGVATIGSANGAALGSIVYNSGTVELPLTAKGNVTLQDFIGIGLQNTWIVEYN
jgi:hypothetical protein